MSAATVPWLAMISILTKQASAGVVYLNGKLVKLLEKASGNSRRPRTSEAPDLNDILPTFTIERLPWMREGSHFKLRTDEYAALKAAILTSSHVCVILQPAF